MSTMTLGQVRDELRATADHSDTEYDKAWAIRLADAIDAHLRERESAKGADLHDRVEFALRDAGFSLDEASTIAQQAVAPTLTNSMGTVEVPACSCCGRTDTLETKCVDCGEIQTIASFAPKGGEG